jgi:hypothetical protein
LLSTPPWSIIRAMSREDSQFKLRLPADLREQIEQAAQESKRSLNAEIVARLEESHFRTGQVDAIPSAKKAREMAAQSRKRTAIEIRKEVLSELQIAINKGATMAQVDLRDMGLDEMSDAEHEETTGDVCRELEAAGYTLDWDGPDHLSVIFER